MTFDIEKVNIVVGGVVLTGFADGSMVSAERNEDSVSPHVGTKGEVSYAESADKTGKFKVTLASTSPHVLYLNRLATGKGTEVDVSIINMNTNAVQVTGTRCRVLKPAGEEVKDEVTDREFEIFAAVMEFE